MSWLDDDAFDGCFGKGYMSGIPEMPVVFFNAYLKVPGKQFIVHNMQKEIIRNCM